MANSKKYLRFTIKLIFALAVISFVVLKGVQVFLGNWTEKIVPPDNSLLLIVVAFILMWLNWSAEALKWKILIKSLKPLSFGESFKGVLAGLSTGILTPNRLGNFIGRTVLLQPEFRIKATLLTLLANLSQFVVTIFFGCLGLLLIGSVFLEVAELSLLLIGLSVLIVGLLIYLQPALIDKKPFNYFFSQQIVDGIHFVNDAALNLKLSVLGIGALRYIIFLTQYALILYAFYPSLDWWTLFAPISVVYLLMTLIPSLFFGKLFVREAAALLVLGAMGIPDAIILLTGFLLWFINIALPALMGMLFLVRNK